MSVDARHSAAMGLLSAYLCNQEIDSLEFAYKHGTPVDIPRNELFLDALMSTATVLVWMDSDCFISTEDIPKAADLIIETHYQEWSFTTAATEQRNGDVNIWRGDDPPNYRSRITEKEIRKRGAKTKFASSARFPIHASGLGFAVFSLAAFRAAWPTGPWFCSHHRIGEDGKRFFRSEDYAFTSRLRSYGMSPHCDPRFVARHVHRGHYED